MAQTENGWEIDKEQICDREIWCLAGKGRYKRSNGRTDSRKKGHVCLSEEPVGVNLPA